MQWRVHLFGAFRVTTANAVLDRFATKKAQSVLAFLAYNVGKRVARAQLLEIFWANEPVEYAQKALRQTLYLIRTGLEPLGEPAIGSDRAAVWLVPSHWTTDLREMQLALCEGQAPAAEIIAYCDESFASWDAEGWTDTALPEAEFIRARTLGAIAQSYRAAGRESEAEIYFERAFSICPGLREAAQRLSDATATNKQEKPSGFSLRLPVVVFAAVCFATLLIVIFTRRSVGTRVDSNDPWAWSRAFAKIPRNDMPTRTRMAADFANGAFTHAYGGDEGFWLLVFEANYSDLDQAVTWASTHDARAALEIAGGLWRYMHLAGHVEHAGAWLDLGLVHASGEPSTALARAETDYAFQIALLYGKNAGRYADKARLIYEKLHDKWGVAHAMRAQGFAEFAAGGDRYHARDLYLSARARFQDLGDEGGVAVTEICLATSRLPDNLLDSEQGIEWTLSAFSRYVRIGNEWGVGFSLDRAWALFRALDPHLRDVKLRKALANDLEEASTRPLQAGESSMQLRQRMRAAYVRLTVRDFRGAKRDLQFVTNHFDGGGAGLDTGNLLELLRRICADIDKTVGQTSEEYFLSKFKRSL